MIGEIQARVADIEARIGALRSRSNAIPARQPTSGSQPTSATAVGVLSHQVAPRAGTLAEMWARAAGRAAPAPSSPTNHGPPGPVPDGAEHYRAAFEAAGARHGVDPALLSAVAWAESNYNPDAVSHAGAIGLMQIMPGTANGLGVDPRDPLQAIDGAARYLRSQLDRFGDVRLALAAYNAGPGAVQKYDGIPPYEETIAYVGKVMGRHQQIRSQQ